jgi:glycosyltransferase involved in cell wall biosynthesis
VRFQQAPHYAEGVSPGKRIFSTNPYTMSQAWLERVDAINPWTMPLLRVFAQIVRAAPKYDAVVVNGEVGWRRGYVDLLGAAAISHRRNGPAVVITDCSWKLSGNVLDRAVCRLGLKLLDSKRVRYTVKATDELALLPEVWGMDRSRVVLTPYGHTLSEEELAAEPSHDGGVFAGGNALRDYETLITSVRGLQTPLTIATSLELSANGARPENVAVVPVHPHSRFIDLMRDAQVVVVPFRAGIKRASGMDTYLSAMGLGNLVIVSECPGVRDYIEDRQTGLIVPPADPLALRAALDWALDPTNTAEVQAIRERAREAARERFTFARHAELLLDVVDEAIAQRRPPGG